MNVPAQPGPVKADSPELPFRVLFESTPGLFLVLEPTAHRIVAVSDALLRATGTARENLIGRSIFEVFPDDPNDANATGTRNLAASLERVTATRAADLLPLQRYPIPKTESEGGGFEERFWSAMNSPVFSDDGELIFIINRSEDLTDFVRSKAREGKEEEGWRMLEARSEHVQSEIALRAYDRRRAEELQRTNRLLQESEAQLRQSAKRFHFLAESMPQKIFTATATGEVDYFNGQWMEFTGLSFEQIRDWGWVQFIHPDDVDENVRRWKRSVDTGEFFEFEHRFRRADGEWRWHISRAHAMRDADGRVIMWIGSNTDIHDVKRVQAEAEQANKTKDKFLAALSHELRTPLTPVLMCAAALERDTSFPPEQREQLGMMRRNVELEARLIDDLLDLTRISRGKMQIDPSITDVHSLLVHSQQIVEADARGKNIEVRSRLEAGQRHVSGDSARLQQVFWNILKNAVKFTPSGGNVTVRTTNPSPDCIAVVISDTGVGIEPQLIKTIFEPFVQGEIAHDSALAGLGLGMSISKTIIELHGGTIAVESAGKGKGCTFTVKLSTVAADEAALEPRSQAANAGHAYRLLVIEDHQPTLQVLAQLLRRQGHSVETAGTVEAARAFAAKQHFDLVITDIGLPDGNGVDLMAELTRDYGLRGIAVSGYGMDEDLARTRAAGFIAHLVKPIDFERLNHVLETIPGNR